MLEYQDFAKRPRGVEHEFRRFLSREFGYNESEFERAPEYKDSYYYDMIATNVVDKLQKTMEILGSLDQVSQHFEGICGQCIRTTFEILALCRQYLKPCDIIRVQYPSQTESEKKAVEDDAEQTRAFENFRYRHFLIGKVKPSSANCNVCGLFWMTSERYLKMKVSIDDTDPVPWWREPSMTMRTIRTTPLDVDFLRSLIESPTELPDRSVPDKGGRSRERTATSLAKRWFKQCFDTHGGCSPHERTAIGAYIGVFRPTRSASVDLQLWWFDLEKCTLLYLREEVGRRFCQANQYLRIVRHS
jgi:hypothetical protein